MPTAAELRRQQNMTLALGGGMFLVVVGLAVANPPRKNPGRRKRKRRLNPGRCPIDVATSMGTTGGVTMGCGGRRRR